MTNALPHTAAPHPPTGIGLRRPHMAQILRERPAVDFLEVHPENYVLDRAARAQLETLRHDYPLSLHSVSLSLGSAEGIDPEALNRLRLLVDELDPFLISDHLSWSTVNGRYLNDLLPLPLTDEALGVFVRNIDLVQSALKRRILVENPSSYLHFERSDFSEPDFLRALVARTGCGILLDVNNVFVSATNLKFSADAYLEATLFGSVDEIHVAGHHATHVDGAPLLIDDHGGPVSPKVWSLYAAAISRKTDTPTLIEWDSNIPALSVLLGERDKALAAAQSGAARREELPLRTLQEKMADQLIALTSAEPTPRMRGHFSVYRNNVRASLSDALRTVYRAVENLVGESFFQQTAWRFIALNAPHMPYIAGYGEAFADFLDALPECDGIPYIGGVARLEWLASRASLGELEPAIAPLALASCADPQALRFHAQAGVAHLQSEYPIDEIWRFALDNGAGTAPVLDSSKVSLEIARGQDGIIIRRLDEDVFEFRRALVSGAALTEAAQSALAINPLFDLAAALHFALRDELFTRCSPEPVKPKEAVPCSCPHLSQI